MQIKMFTIALFGEDDKLDELNRFLRGNKILGVREESVCSGGECFWTYSVRYFTDAAASKTTGSKKKDYRSELDEPTFQYFLTLKQRRKRIADRHAVPVYVVFTNEELAAIAKFGREASIADLGSISGIGRGKLEKYGEQILSQTNDQSQ